MGGWEEDGCWEAKRRRSVRVWGRTGGGRSMGVWDEGCGLGVGTGARAGVTG